MCWLAQLITMTWMTHGISSLQTILENVAADQVQATGQQLEKEVQYILSHPDV